MDCHYITPQYTVLSFLLLSVLFMEQREEENCASCQMTDSQATFLHAQLLKGTPCSLGVRTRERKAEGSDILSIPDPLLVLGKTASCQHPRLQNRIRKTLYRSQILSGYRGPVSSTSCPTHLSICFLWFSTSRSKACFSDSLSCSFAICSSSFGGEQKRENLTKGCCHLQLPQPAPAGEGITEPINRHHPPAGPPRRPRLTPAARGQAGHRGGPRPGASPGCGRGGGGISPSRRR